MIRPWTEAETSELHRLFAKGYTDANIGAAIGRTAIATRDRRCAIGLFQTKSSPYWAKCAAYSREQIEWAEANLHDPQARLIVAISRNLPTRAYTDMPLRSRRTAADGDVTPRVSHAAISRGRAPEGRQERQS